MEKDLVNRLWYLFCYHKKIKKESDRITGLLRIDTTVLFTRYLIFIGWSFLLSEPGPMLGGSNTVSIT